MPATDSPVPSTAPVILIATANEDEGARHLRSLELELRDIVSALEQAQREGICEVVTLSDATPEQVVQTFQDESYRDRIAILHFAGHAGPEGLLFETGGGSTAVADAGGLAQFLGYQRGLQLVVLNACATQAHVDALRDAGVGAVVATSRTVEDAIAHQFAVLLYQGLGSGAGIKRAYDEAAAGVRFKHGAIARGSTADSMHASAEATTVTTGATSRAITRKGAVTTDDGRWPWDLYFRPGAEESVAPWALPDAAGNPLFGLPKLPETDQPLAEPFRHLRPFARAHAELFFGRGKDIRALYDKVTSATSESVVLLYGATGVGKSSLLDAGVLPRLTNTHEVRYAPRDRSLGLLGTLAKALGVDAVGASEAAAVAVGWRALETQCGRPLFVVIDQVEEAYTSEDAGRAPPGAGTRELDAFAAAIGPLFANPADRPRGRLVLGFRKEWLSEVKAALETHRVARTEHRLEQLTRAGVLEAITGPTRIPARRMATKLEIEPGVDVLIADDLLAKRASHVAPLLQILLATMWSDATRRGDVVRFDAALYEAVQAKSKQLDKFLDEQLDALRTWSPGVVDSGLALDFLRYYTTPKGSSDEHAAEEEAQRYPNANEASPGLRAMCARLFLLVERVDDAGTPPPGRPARLAHDTLAPIVRDRFDRSDLPGPRAKRVLDGRSAEWKDGKMGIPLDAQDLSIVEEGQAGMRAWNDEEKALIAASRIARERARRRRAWVVRGAVASVVTIVAFGFGSWFLYRQSQDRLAESTSRELSGRALATTAERRDVSLLYGVAAYERAPTFEARRALLSQVGRDPALIRVLPTLAREIAFIGDGRRLVAATDSGIRIYDIESGVATPAPNEPKLSLDRLLSLDQTGSAYATVTGIDSAALTTTIGAWDVETGTALGLLRVPMESVDRSVSWTLSPPMRDGRRHVAIDDGNDVVLWDLTSGKPKRRLRGSVRVNTTVFSNDGSILVVTSEGSKLVVWDVAAGTVIKTIPTKPNEPPQVAISEDNSAVALQSRGTLQMWWLREAREPRRLEGAGYTHPVFLGDGSALVVHAPGGRLEVFEKPIDQAQRVESDAPSRSLRGVGDIPAMVIASGQGKRVASLYNGFVHVWDLTDSGGVGGDHVVTTSALPIARESAMQYLTPDGRFALEEAGSHLVVWDVESGRQIGDSILATMPDSLAMMTLSGAPIVLGGAGRFIVAPKLDLGPHGARLLYDIQKPDRLPVLSSKTHSMPGMEPSGTRIAYGLMDTRRLVIEDLANPGRPDTLDPGPGEPADPIWGAAPAFSARGNFVVTQPTMHRLLVWDLSTKRVRDSLDLDHYASELYISDDGGIIAARQDYFRTVTFWRHGAPKPIRTLRMESEEGLLGSALSPDGSLFAIATDTTVILADVARGEAIGHIMVGSGGGGVAFVDGGRAIVALGRFGRVQRITLDAAIWASRACRVGFSAAALPRFAQDAPAGIQPPERCARVAPR